MSEGAWVISSGKVWNSQHQAWEDAWNKGKYYYYNEGNEYTSITGGWTQSGYTYYPGSKYYFGALNKYADHMFIDGYNPNDTSWGYKQGGVGTANVISGIAGLDVYLAVEVEGHHNSGYYFSIIGISNKASVVYSVIWRCYTYDNTLVQVGTYQGHPLYKGTVPSNASDGYLYIQSNSAQLSIYALWFQ